MSWRTRLGSLLGGKAPPPAKGKPKSALPAKTLDRAQLIADAMALHRQLGAPLRADLQRALKALEDRRTLRDPAALERLLALAQARRAIAGLLSGGLRRYVVLAGLRQWGHGGEKGGDAGSGSAKPTAGKVVVRR